MVTDEEQEDQLEGEESSLKESKTPAPKLPANNDFMAGAMLANGIVFVWMQILSIFRQTASQVPPRILVDLSYMIYIFAGYFASRQVVKRTEKEHLKVGLKTAGYSTIMGLLIIYTMANEPTMGLAVTLGVCYVAGSIIGSYMEIRARLQRLRAEASS